jgi:hypothetical protein
VHNYLSTCAATRRRELEPDRDQEPRAIPRAGKRCGIATAVLVDIPDVSHRAQLVLVHRLADQGASMHVNGVRPLGRLEGVEGGHRWARAAVERIERGLDLGRLFDRGGEFGEACLEARAALGDGVVCDGRDGTRGR